MEIHMTQPYITTEMQQYADRDSDLRVVETVDAAVNSQKIDQVAQDLQDCIGALLARDMPGSTSIEEGRFIGSFARHFVPKNEALYASEDFRLQGPRKKFIHVPEALAPIRGWLVPGAVNISNGVVRQRAPGLVRTDGTMHTNPLPQSKYVTLVVGEAVPYEQWTEAGIRPLAVLNNLSQLLKQHK